MLTLGNFIGAFLTGLTKGRVQSDNTSFKASQAYLNHEFLRGFPVPRMTLKNVDLELNFSVGPTTQLEHLLKEPEVINNILNQFKENLQKIPQSKELQPLLGNGSRSSADWDTSVNDLTSSMHRILTSSQPSPDALIHILTLAIENFFYNLHNRNPSIGFLSSIRSLFSKQSPQETTTPGTNSAVRDWAFQQVTQAIEAALPNGKLADANSIDLYVLLGSDLEGKHIDHLHKAKLSFHAEDRKWVASEKNGEKKYILDR